MKTQLEYLEILEEELRYLKQQETNEIIKHYRDKINLEIDYGTPEEKVIRNLPNPKDVAKEIYDSRGISYLEIQKRKYRRKEIFQAILSGFIISLMAFLFVGITIFIGFTSANITSLGIKALSFKTIDMFITILLVLSYLLMIAVGYLFIIDLFYIIISFFLANILRAIKKTYKPYYKFTHFTVTGFISEKCKVKRLLPTILVSLVGVVILVSVGSYFTKGYMYRSINDQPAISEIKNYDVNLKEIYIEGAKSNIIIDIDESLKEVVVEYKYEFTNSFEITKQEKTLKIKKESVKSFDILGLMEEPTPQIIVKLPSEEYLKLLNIKLDEGYLYLKNINSTSLELVLDVYKLDFYLENVNLRNVEIESYNANIKIMNTDEDIDYSKITNMNANIKKGNLYMQGVQVLSNLTVDNGNAEIILDDCKFNELIIKNLGGSLMLNNIFGENLDLSTSSSTNVFDCINFANIKLSGLKSTKIDISRIMVRDNLEISAISKAIFNIQFLKAKEIKINNQSSIINLLNINHQNEIIDSDKDTIKNKKEIYNNFSSSNIKLNIESNGETYISDSVLEELNIKQEGMVLHVSDSNIKKAEIDALNVKNISFEKVTGSDIYFILNNSPLNYYNYDEGEVNVRIRYKGVSKVMADIEYDVEK